MEIFNWGLIGPGRIAHQFAKALNADFVGRLYAVASNNAQRSKDFSQQYQAQVSYHNYADLLADPKVDAVYIATPHNFHYEQIKQCLMANKAVLCEKPLTVNYEQAKELIELAKNRNLFLMEAMWSLYLPIYQTVNNWIQSGAIGEVKLIHSTFGFAVPRNESDRLLNPDLAGGVLLDMGIYCVATAQWFSASYPSKIQASGLIGSTGVDELTMVNLTYPDNKFAQFSCNFLTQTDNSLYINGTKGRIKIDDMFWAGTTASLIVDDTTTRVTKPHAETGFEYEIAEAESCIKQKKLESSIVSHKETLQNMKIMETVLQQLKP